jgi:ubiquinone/menaquinone biosynthesis C-methylase UbiE
VSHDGVAREFGLDRGKVFPAAHARSLLNPARRLVQSPRRTIAAMEIRSGARVLELGCGPGFFSPHLAAVAQQLVLVDVQFEMLRLADERLASRQGLGYAQADGCALPLATGSFDAVLIATVLGEIPDPGACIDEVRRILQPGGTLAVAETRRDSDFISLASLQRLVEPRGFTLVTRHGPRWQYVARFHRT